MRQTETHYLQTGFDIRKLVAIFLITAGCGDDLDDDVANELFLDNSVMELLV